MKLLDELRNVEPGNPGNWSRRISVTLACTLLLLVTAIGLQVRVRAMLLPQLASAVQALAGLEKRLQEARRAERRTHSLRSELQQLEEQLQRTGATLPRGAESLDLAVLLAVGSTGSPVEEVRPWQPAIQTSGRIPHLGAEMRITGRYGEIISAIGMVLAAGELRELAEISIESGESPENGRLRAEARLLAYFADESQAEGFPDVDPRQRTMAMAPPPRKDLPSPFATRGGEMREDATTARGDERESARRGGVIRVGTRRYRIVDDSEGRLRLHPDTA